jgi:hypothetical protein
VLQSFVNPALVAGTALCAIPLIIHLLNRQRHKPHRWAAMRFVLAAYRKTRRRVQLENLLLLLLRMAAVILLALAVARPFATGENPLVGLTENRRDVLIAIDASASTGYREDVDSVFANIVERAREIVEELDTDRHDQVRLILAGDHPRLLSWTTPENALAILPTLIEPTDEALDLPALVGEILSIVKKDAAGTQQSSLELRLLTDLQRRSFDGTLIKTEEGKPILSEQLDLLDAYGVKLFVEDLGPKLSTPPNLTLESVAPTGPLIGAGAPIEISVSVMNHGESPRAGVRVALEVDGVRLPSQRVDVGARSRTEAIFSLDVSDPGAHTLVASLEGDRLAIDDERSHVIVVPAPIRVLVVNGSRKTAIEDDETGFLMAILDPPDDSTLPGAGGLSPFDPREISPEILTDPDLDLADYEVLVLANVTSISEAAVLKLEERVAAGASLLVTVGDRVLESLETYNNLLFQADGSGLLPAVFTRHIAVASRRDGYYRVQEFDQLHPALSFFADVRWKGLFTEAPVYQFLGTRPLDSALVVARLDDEARSPLLIERAYDRGRVFLWTSSIDKDWTFIPESPRTFVPLVHELVRYAGQRHSLNRNLAPGQAIALEAPVFPRTPELVRPDGSRRAVDGEATELGGGRWSLPLIPGDSTTSAGLYRVELEGAAPEAFAVQMASGEGDLQRMSVPELASIHPGLVFVERDASGGVEDSDNPRRGELWRLLALCTLFALVAESLWGAWLGYKRRVA